MTDDDGDAREVWKASSEQSRHETDAVESEESEGTSEATERRGNPTPLSDAIRDAYARIDDRDLPQNVTVRDANLAALFAGLDEAGELEAVGRDAADYLDRDPDDVNANLETTAGVGKLLFRIGLQAVAEEHLKTAVDARREYQAEAAGDEF